MKHKNTNREYAFLMIDYETNDFIKDIQNKIKEQELYKEEDNNDYGFDFGDNGWDFGGNGDGCND